jgi:ribonuclease BN (tRNA processing enzyme)
MLNFLGIGSAFNTELGNTSAYLKNGKSIFLIDCGSTVFNRLQKTNLLENVTNMYIVITHTHPDHIGSLGELIFYSHYVLSCKPKVLSPENDLIKKILLSMGVKDELYNILDSSKSNLKDNDIDIDVTFFPASQVETIPSYSLLLNLYGKTVYYSGDSNKIDISIIQKLKSGAIDMVYQDTCGLDYEGNPHMYLGKLADLVEPDFRNKIYCMHLDQRFDKNEALKLGFNIAQIKTSK